MSEVASALPRTRFEEAMLAAARAAANVVLPAVLAGVAFRYLIPTVAEAHGTWAEGLGTAGDEHGVVIGLALFVGFSLIARYWSDVWFGATIISTRVAPAVAPQRNRSSARLVLPIAIAALVAVVFRGVYFGAYRVLSASMLPTLEPEDWLGGSRTAYGGFFLRPPDMVPQRGDIVVFDKPSGVEGPGRLVKRVIGLPGDIVTMNGPHPVINGWEVPSCDAGPYVYPLPQGGAVVGRLSVEFLDERAYLSIFAPVSTAFREYEVRQREVFVLGDNRNNSSDSRSWNKNRGGGLSLSHIEARVKWWLLGLQRSGHVDLHHLTKQLELQPRLEGVSGAQVRESIEHCLQNRPADTHPPGPHAK